MSTVIKMVLSQLCRGRFRLSSSLSCEAPLCLPRTGPAASLPSSSAVHSRFGTLSRRRRGRVSDANERSRGGPQQNTSRERCSKASRECGPKRCSEASEKESGPDALRECGPEPLRECGPEASRESGQEASRECGPEASRECGPEASMLRHRRGPLEGVRGHRFQQNTSRERCF